MSWIVLIFSVSVADLLSVVAVGKVHEHRVPGRALNERADRGDSESCFLPEDQIALPMAGNRAVISLGGTL